MSRPNITYIVVFNYVLGHFGSNFVLDCTIELFLLNYKVNERQIHYELLRHQNGRRNCSSVSDPGVKIF